MNSLDPLILFKFHFLLLFFYYYLLQDDGLAIKPNNYVAYIFIIFDKCI